jgi:MFS family permease
MSEPSRSPAGLAPLLSSVAVLVLGSGLLGTLLALRMDGAGVPVWLIGAVMACYSVGFVGGTLAGPGLIGRVGHVRAFAACAAALASAALAHPLAEHGLAWAALRAASGFSAACLFTVAESWINAASANGRRGRALSTYMAVSYVAQAGSQAMLGWIGPGGFAPFSLVAILVALSLVPLALARGEGPREERAVRLGLARLVRISPLGVAGCFGAGLMGGAFGSLGPVYANALDADPAWVARFMAVAVAAGFALQVPVGRLSDRFDRRSVFLGLCLGVAATAAALALGGSADGGMSEVPLLALLAGFGGLAYCVYPTALAHANDHMRPEEIVPASAGLLLTFGLGSIAGPALASAAMGALGPAGLFWHVASTAALLALYAAWRMTRRAALPLGEQGPFVPLPPSATAPAFELTPRAPDPGDAPQDGAPAGGAPADGPFADRPVTGVTDLRHAAE